MTFKTILVHCDADKAAGQRIGVATELAAKFGSRLIGLHVRPPFLPPALYDGSFVMDQLYKVYEDGLASDQAASLAAFDKATKNSNVAVERRIVDGPVDQEVIKRARCADLVVLGQTNSGSPTATPPDLPEVVALSSGRPVLVVPYVEIRRPVGTTIILCWNASREAARAASDALPLLKNAAKVVVLVVRSADDEEASSAGDAVEWLSHHGVKAVAIADAAADVDVANLILSRAADLSADLIVMGVYGHARVREMVLGGVSRSLLQTMTIPLFMAH